MLTAEVAKRELGLFILFTYLFKFVLHSFESLPRYPLLLDLDKDPIEERLFEKLYVIYLL